MQTRSKLALAALLVATCFLSFQVIVQDPDRIADQGWAGPHPRQLVSYHVVATSANRKWGPAVTVLSSVPRSGLIITSVTIIPDVLATYANTQFRLMSNTVKRIGQWQLGNNVTQITHGLVVPPGPPLSIQLTSSYVGPMSVTITGYTY